MDFDLSVQLENYSFYDLLVDLTKIEGLKRLRISSIETSQITDDIIDLISKSKIIVDHLCLLSFEMNHIFQQNIFWCIIQTVLIF